LFNRISKTLKITREFVQYVVIVARKYLDIGLRLKEGQSYSFIEVLKDGIKG